MGDVKSQAARGWERQTTRGPGAGTRRARARATRLRIAEVAARLFSEQGYAGTTMGRIAQVAGVAIQTVYFTFHTKAELLIEAMIISGGGPEPTSEVMARGWIEDAFAAPDGARRLAIAVDAGVEIYRRVAPLVGALTAAASTDPDVRAAWNRVVGARRTGMGRLIEIMHERDELRPNLAIQYATDILFGLHRHELFLAFTGECGWSVETYKAWTYATLCRELLPADAAAAAVEPGSPATAGTSFTSALETLPL